MVVDSNLTKVTSYAVNQSSLLRPLTPPLPPLSWLSDASFPLQKDRICQSFKCAIASHYAICKCHTLENNYTECVLGKNEVEMDLSNKCHLGGDCRLFQLQIPYSIMNILKIIKSKRHLYFSHSFRDNAFSIRGRTHKDKNAHAIGIQTPRERETWNLKSELRIS